MRDVRHRAFIKALSALGFLLKCDGHHSEGDRAVTGSSVLHHISLQFRSRVLG